MIERIKLAKEQYAPNRPHTIVLGKAQHTELMREFKVIYKFLRGPFNFVEGLRIVKLKEINCFKVIGDFDV